MSIERSFGAVVYTESETYSPAERLYLLVHHASGGHWDHPKGHAEPGEEPLDTARREIGEESGIEIEFVEGFSIEEKWILPNGKPKAVIYFLARKTGITKKYSPIEGEIQEIRWLSYKEALELISYETGRRVLKDANDFISLASKAESP